MKYFVRSFSATLFLLAIASSSLAEEHLTILHFNDMHGHLENGARIATVVKNIRAENEAKGRHTLVLFGGDLVSGTPVSSRFRGRAEIEFLNEIGLNAMVLGNHDFDYGRKALSDMQAAAKFDIISANVLEKETGKTLEKPYVVLDLAPDLKVAVFGISHPGTPLMTSSESVADLDFENPVKISKKTVKERRKDKKANVLVAPTHEGVQNDVTLAKKVPDIDLIVGGHDHVEKDAYCQRVKEEVLCQTPCNGAVIGKIDLTIDGNKVERLSFGLIGLDGVKEDKHARAILAPYVDDVNREMKEVIGVAVKDYPHWREVGKTTDLGLMLTTAVKNSTGVDIAMLYGSGIRRSLKKGNITRGDIEEILPFDNTIFTLKMSGADIEWIRERMLKKGKSMQFAGITSGDKLEPGKMYTIATDSFLYNGGEGLSVFKKKGKDAKNSGILVRDTVINYIKKEKRI